jgi:hypothetical protein
VGAGGGVVSFTIVSMEYCIHAFAIVSLGNHNADSFGPCQSIADFGSSGANDSVANPPNHPSLIFIFRSGPLGDAGNRAVKHASSHGIARYRWLPQS